MNNFNEQRVACIEVLGHAFSKLSKKHSKDIDMEVKSIDTNAILN